MLTLEFKAAILGLVEGLTEYLPISSTGHLIIMAKWLKFDIPNAAVFEIAIQFGAILAVLWVYRDYFLNLAQPKNWLSRDTRVLATTCVPVAIVGLLAHHWIKKYLFTSPTVAIALILGGVIIILIETIAKPKTTTVDIKDISYSQALIVGLSQCASLWPGMSRSASTIVGGRLAGLDYATAAKFSFIVAIPTMTLAVVFDLLSSLNTLQSSDFILISIGLVIAFLSAILVITNFIKLIARFHLAPFAVYRILLGIGILYAYL